jgi:hypothetical protein
MYEFIEFLFFVNLLKYQALYNATVMNHLWTSTKQTKLLRIIEFLIIFLLYLYFMTNIIYVNNCEITLRHVDHQHTMCR